MDLYDEIAGNKHNVSPQKLIKLLTSYGFKYRRTTGDHEIYKRNGYRPFTVPINQNPLAIHIIKEALSLIEEIRERER